MASEFTHLDPLGRARMVDVTAKDPSHRRAVARCRVTMEPETAAKIASGAITKGDVLAVARIAGIQAAKQTSNMLPLCHPLLVGSVFVNFRLEEDHVEVETQVDTVDRGMTIGQLALWEKTGGRSGVWRREGRSDNDIFGL